MLIGKAGPAISSICTADATRIEVRGRDLCRDIMGQANFTEYFYLLVTGREPDPQQRFFLDLLLVAIAEHGLTPTAQAARMTYAAAPDSLQGAVAAGLLGCGTVVLGTAELCGQVLTDIDRRRQHGTDPDQAARTVAADIKAAGGRMPGFGHPLHRPLDPRAERILELADQHAVAGRYCDLLKRLRPVVAEIWGKPLPLNVSGPIAAVLLDLNFPPAMLKAIPLLARTAGLLAHLAEEQTRPIGFLMAHHGEAAVSYQRATPATPEQG